MEQRYDSYTGDSVYYDTESGDFCKLQYTPHNSEMNILSTDGKELDSITSELFEPNDFYEVSYEATETPEEIVKNHLESLLSDSIQTPLQMKDYVDLKWAYQNTTFSPE